MAMAAAVFSDVAFAHEPTSFAAGDPMLSTVPIKMRPRVAPW
jgi:hypothetical protein